MVTPACLRSLYNITYTAQVKSNNSFAIGEYYCAATYSSMDWYVCFMQWAMVEIPFCNQISIHFLPTSLQARSGRLLYSFLSTEVVSSYNVENHCWYTLQEIWMTSMRQTTEKTIGPWSMPWHSCILRMSQSYRSEIKTRVWGQSPRTLPSSDTERLHFSRIRRRILRIQRMARRCWWFILHIRRRRRPNIRPSISQSASWRVQWSFLRYHQTPKCRLNLIGWWRTPPYSFLYRAPVSWVREIGINGCQYTVWVWRYWCCGSNYGILSWWEWYLSTFLFYAPIIYIVLKIIGSVNPNATTFNPPWPGSCPWITSVGGTQVKANAFTTDAEPEEVWNEALGLGFFTSSGGGFSNRFAIPDYQTHAVSTYLAYLRKKNPSLLAHFNATGVSSSQSSLCPLGI